MGKSALHENAFNCSFQAASTALSAFIIQNVITGTEKIIKQCFLY